MRLLIVAICAALFTLSSSFTFVPPSSFLYRSISIRIGEYGPQTGHGNTGLRAVHSNTGFDAAAAGFDTVIDTVIDTVNVDTVPDRSSRRSALSSILKCTSFMTVTTVMTTVMTTVIPNNVALADDGETAAVGDDLSMPEAPKPLTPEEEKKLVEERLAKKAALQKKTAR